MKTKYRLELVAAAVSLALGSATALAQPEQDRDAREPQTQAPAGPQDEPRQQQPGSDDSPQQSQRQPGSSRDTEEGSQQQTAAGSESIDELAREHDELSTFVEALKSTGLANSLTGGTSYTVFAPTNDAFESMQGRSLDELTSDEDRQELISLLRAHIVADDVDEEMARRIQSADTVAGGTVELSTQGESLMVGDATAEDEPIELGNLRVYRIDGVLSSNAPASVAQSGDAGQSGDAAEQAETDRAAQRDDDLSAAQDREQPAQSSSRDAERVGESQGRDSDSGRAADAGQADGADAGQRQAGDSGADAERGSADAEGSYPSFEDADRNSDGEISRTELAMIEGLDFTTADENQDGQLDRSEYRQATEQ